MRRILSAVLFCASGAAWAGPTELVYGSWIPQSDFLNTDALPKAFEQIAKETGGAVKWKIVPGGQLTDQNDTYSAIEGGIMDGGSVIPSANPSLLPSMAMIYSIAVEGQDVVAAAGAAIETVMLDCPSCLAEARAHNAIPLGGGAGSPMVLMCSQPIASAAELKGLKIRTSGAATEIMALAGAETSNISLPEAPALLARKGLDCTTGSYVFLKVFGLSEVTPFVTNFSLGIAAPALALYMNRTSFEALSLEQKKAQLRGAAYLGATLSLDLSTRLSGSVLNEEINNHGVKLVEPDIDFQELFDRYKAGERGASIERAIGLGVEKPEAILDAYERNVEKWRKLSDAIGGDTAKLAETLWQEVYSKVDPDSL